MVEQKPMQNAFARAVLAAGGIFYAVSGAALFFAPQWFYDNIGTYPPFNRHYAGDVGSFLLPMGIAMLIASRNPAQHRLLFGFAVAGSVLHALNHMLDELVLSPSTSQLLTGSIPLIIFAVILLAAYLAQRPRRAIR
jgi:hypothetical protein